MNPIVIENIYSKILETSSLELQRKLWLNEHNDTGLISSYVELMCQLFDDNDFDGFIDKKAAEAGFSSEIILELDKLRALLNNYQEGERTDAEIISDPEWQKVVDQAKVVIGKWNR